MKQSRKFNQPRGGTNPVGKWSGRILLVLALAAVALMLAMAVLPLAIARADSPPTCPDGMSSYLAFNTDGTTYWYCPSARTQGELDSFYAGQAPLPGQAFPAGPNYPAPELPLQLQYQPGYGPGAVNPPIRWDDPYYWNYSHPEGDYQWYYSYGYQNPSWGYTGYWGFE